MEEASKAGAQDEIVEVAERDEWIIIGVQIDKLSALIPFPVVEGCQCLACLIRRQIEQMGVNV